MVVVHLFIEGGGDSRQQDIQFREAFRRLFERAGFVGRMPRVWRGGGRRQTHDAFCTAVDAARKRSTNRPRKRRETIYPILLLDSEEVVESPSADPDSQHAWRHLANRKDDELVQPDGTSADQAQLMATCMETWVVADVEALRLFYGDCLRENALPPTDDLESRTRDDVQARLKSATHDCGERKYTKGRHSFQVVARLNPSALQQLLPHFDRLIRTLHRHCGKK